MDSRSAFSPFSIRAALLRRVDNLLPCVVCGRAGGVLCSGCLERRLKVDLALGFPVWCLARHQSPRLRAAVLALKYQERTFLAGLLGAALARMWETLPESTDTTRDSALVPVPLHPERLALRGYNQSALLARACSARTGLKFTPRGLRRIRHGSAQAGLSGAKRRRNLHGAFLPSASLQRQDSSGLILIDDVVTTGSTLAAASVALRSQKQPVRGALCLALGGRQF